MSIEFILHLFFESSMSLGSDIMMFGDYAIATENIKNEHFVLNPHRSRLISDLSPGSGSCTLLIHKSMVELCRFLGLSVN